MYINDHKNIRELKKSEEKLLKKPKQAQDLFIIFSSSNKSNNGLEKKNMTQIHIKSLKPFIIFIDQHQ